MKGFNKNVAEGLFNPKTVGTDTRMTNPLLQRGQELGANAVPAQQLAYEQYRAAALGQAPSVAQAQLQAGMEANQRAAMALAARTRGGNIAGAFDSAMAAGTGAMLATNQQAAMLRAAEMEAGRAGLGALGGQLAGQQFGYDQLVQDSTINMRGQDLNYNLGKRGMDIQQEANDRQFWGGLAQAGIGALGSVLGGVSSVASDERIKNSIEPASIADEAAQLEGIQYNYDAGLGEPAGRQFGLGAGQVARSPLGPTLVQQGPDGVLRLDGARAGVVGLAAAGETQRRLDALEQRLMAREGSDGYYGTPEDGARREAEARRRSDEIAMSRAHHRLGLGARPIDPFEGAPQMRRSGPSQPIDPFSPAPPPSYAQSVAHEIGSRAVRQREPDISPMLRPAARTGGATPVAFDATQPPQDGPTHESMLRDAEQQRYDRGLLGSMSRDYPGLESERQQWNRPGLYRDPIASDPRGYGDVRQPWTAEDAQYLAMEDAAREALERTTMQARSEDGTVTRVPRLGGPIDPMDPTYSSPSLRRVDNIDRMERSLGLGATPPASKRKKDPAWVRRVLRGQSKRDKAANDANAIIEALRNATDSVDAEVERQKVML